MVNCIETHHQNVYLHVGSYHTVMWVSVSKPIYGVTFELNWANFTFVHSMWVVCTCWQCTGTRSWAVECIRWGLPPRTPCQSGHLGHLGHLANQDTLPIRTSYQSGHLASQDTLPIRTPCQSGHLTNQDAIQNQEICKLGILPPKALLCVLEWEHPLSHWPGRDHPPTITHPFPCVLYLYQALLLWERLQQRSHVGQSLKKRFLFPFLFLHQRRESAAIELAMLWQYWNV